MNVKFTQLYIIGKSEIKNCSLFKKKNENTVRNFVKDQTSAETRKTIQRPVNALFFYSRRVLVSDKI